VKKAGIVIAALAATAALSWPSPPGQILHEDFEGATFPPPGWRVVTSGEGGHYWERRYESSYYAHGQISLVHGQYPHARLVSRYLSLKVGDTVTLKFRYKAGYSGHRWAPGWIVEIRGPGYIRGNYLNLAPSWSQYERTFPRISTASDRYYVEWHLLSRVQYGGSYGYAWYWVDDVYLLGDTTSVAPTSLGRVKALFR
jgi:hypothetical protein